MAAKRLVILGGGFGGLDVARAIGRSRDARGYWDTVLIDKENFFQFNPLLPAVAVGAVETRHIVYPFREMARHRHIRFYKNKARRIDLQRREVVLHNDRVEPFDALVVAVGSVTNYYGVPGAPENTRPFKTLVDAMTLRARVVELFEMAEQADSPAQRRRLLSFAIVGGGVTGVEVAAELLEMARDTLLPRYPSLRRSDLRVTLIEGGDRVVPAARPEHSAYAQRFLVRRGVDVRVSARAARVEPRRVVLATGEAIDAMTIVWTAGVCPPALVTELPLRHTPDGRVVVDERLRALDPEGRPVEDVFVIGDPAASRRADGKLQPQLSQTAIAMGVYVGSTLVARPRGRTLPPFTFHDVGYIISLGQHSSVLELFGVPLSGRLAWLAWAGAYLIKMVGFRKQIEVGIDHVLHFFFEHDTSQILNRRQVLSDDELNLSLGAPDPGAPAHADEAAEHSPAARN
ncbi:MAG TPA: NAD(P)/FAD-dependent oxidoreductase [Candidatus Saccharimonadaceae bacterium]|jgi:NADH dehydrogenase|nr:NAD(P)/FAD-dependent oxidoreductase [Candidatus Saccharimonadaceae bacterium]